MRAAIAGLAVLALAGIGYLLAQDDPEHKEDPAMQALQEQTLLKSAKEKGLQTATFSLG